VQRVARQVLPSSVTTSFGGTAQAFQSSQTGLVFLLVLAVLVIYLVLGILYESFIHPLTILSALPFAGFGALVTLLLFRIELSVYAFVGIIMLVGLVKKNGIMMIDFALEAQRTEGKSPTEAILTASSGAEWRSRRWPPLREPAAPEAKVRGAGGRGSQGPRAGVLPVPAATRFVRAR